MSPGRCGLSLPVRLPHCTFSSGLLPRGLLGRGAHFPEGEAEVHFPARASAERGPSRGSPDVWSAAALAGLVRNACLHQLGSCRLMLRSQALGYLSGRTNLLRTLEALLELMGTGRRGGILSKREYVFCTDNKRGW